MLHLVKATRIIVHGHTLEKALHRIVDPALATDDTLAFHNDIPGHLHILPVAICQTVIQRGHLMEDLTELILEAGSVEMAEIS